MRDSLDLSRRRFLERLGGVAALGGLGAVAPWAAQAANIDAGGGDVRIGIIGTGSRGRTLLQNLLKARGCRIVALCDDQAPHLAQAQKLMPQPAPGFADHRAMIDAGGLDAVVIATPLHVHAPQTFDALDAGLHVWCEKAMARTVADCRAMVARADTAGKLLQIGHQRLFNPTYLKAIKRVRAGEIGTVTQIRASWHRQTNWRKPVPVGSALEQRTNWRLYREFSGGLMTELGTHQIQIANWVLDDVPERVMGSGSICFWKDGRTVYDHVALIYEYAGGRKLIYTSLLNNRRYGCEEQIQGSKGTIEPELGRIYFENAPPPVAALRKLEDDVAKGRKRPVPIGGRTWFPELPIVTPGESLGWSDYDETTLQFEAFAASVRANKPLRGALREAFHASIASLLGEQAMDERRAIDWPRDLTMPRT
ncbi:Gfo/Idh/MocA family oxidoreductase [Sphingomonas suaedae]|uniref:Gfo/Idh/MocA family oxidoreductase n=1 Tax=Sphingomonas suaedae TaxID=2599297 RepID=A0A518RHH6_9SPHN|nr:Gfo/Idh/MocA family oxidoreductase [Sphingomonas suaedae]QDX26891.1 Gfo/Idh/MocA family oxidoreductase [Sphingomonas suaedae]